MFRSIAPARRNFMASYRWIPWAFVAAFVIVFAVNGGLIYYASESWPGLTTDHAYDEGLAYNRVIDEAASEAELGWKMEVSFAAGAAGGAGRLVIVARDATGAALEGLVWRGELIRPVGDEVKLPVQFVPEGEGRYVASFAPPRPGQWNLYLAASRDGTQWHGGQRLMVPAS